jgi:transposase InsO family protein
MLKNHQLEGVTLTGPKHLDNCYSCAVGKQARHPLVSDPDKPATNKLGLVHMDLMGPFKRPTRQGHTYVLTIIDDCSRYCWVEFLSKSDAFQTFVNWAGRAERTSGCQINRIRSDNGGEFQNKAMASYCAAHHYTQEFTNPYTPQQNGVAERFNRTVMETVRCLLAGANLSSLWWAEALQCAVYMRNRVAHSSTYLNRSPYQSWTGLLPQLHRMHIFGSKCNKSRSSI